METLFIDRKDITLSVDNSRLMVKYPDQSRNSLPMAQIKTIVAGSGLNLDSNVLRMLDKHRINLIITNARDSQAVCVTTPHRHGSAERRLRQYQLLCNPLACLLFSRRLMRLKLHGQLQCIRQWLSKRPDQRYALTGHLKSLELACQQSAQAKSLAQLRGIEGRAAASYFQALAINFAPSLGFNSRNKRPPRDPVNVVLSLTYSLLQHEAINAINAFGLDPLLGFYHQLDYGRESLACDLIEPLRVRADAFALTLFSTTLLNSSQFSIQTDGSCRMNKTGRSHFYSNYFDHAPIWRSQLRKMAAIYVSQLDCYKRPPHG